MMNKNRLVEQLVQCVQRVITECDPTVPSAPLVHMADVANTLDVIADELPDEVMHLISAAQDMGWGFWPYDEYGSRLADVSIHDISQLAEALETYWATVRNAE